MNRTNPKVDGYVRKNKRWQDELEKLRAIILDCPLTEGMKWMCPCYTHQNSNIVLIHVFKEYCALLFFKGALLKDAKGILVQQTKNTQALRQIRFANVREIVKLEPVLKDYINEAIEVEKAGLKVTLKKTSEFEMPEEFQTRLDEAPALKKAFAALTPGRQRGYLLYFSGAKQSKTRASRIEKSLKQILKGKGLDDDYTATKRSILRWVHIVFGLTIIGYVYGPPEEVLPYRDNFRFFFVPVIVFTGLWMWKGDALRRLVSKKSA